MRKRHSLPAVASGVLLGLAILAPDVADAQRRGGGGGGHMGAHGGGGGRAAAHGGGRAAPSSISHAGNRSGGGNVNRNANLNRNTNVNRNANVNVNRNVNIDVDNHGRYGWNDHPIATGVAIGATAAITSAAIGSMIYSLPPACSPYRTNYYYCNGVYYEPRYQGSTVTYVVVNQPY